MSLQEKLEMPGLGVRGSEAWRRAFTSLYYMTVNTSFAACGDSKICTALPPFLVASGG